MILYRDDLEEALKGYPNIAARFRKVAESRMSEVNKKRSRNKRMDLTLTMDAVKGIAIS